MKANTGISGISIASRFGAVINPLRLSPVLWLKADAGTFQTVGGSSASIDGDPIGQWQDQSGNGNHISTAFDAKRFTFKSNIKNSLPTCRSDGVDDLLSTSYTEIQPTTRVIVVRDISSANDKIFISGKTGDTDIYHNTNSYSIYAGSSVTGGSFSDGNFGIIQAIFNGASSKIRLNGGSWITGNCGAQNAGGITVGGYRTGASYTNADFAEILDFSYALSDSQMNDLLDYLNYRWLIY